MINLTAKQQVQLSFAVCALTSALLLCTLFYDVWGWRSDFYLTRTALKPEPTLAAQDETSSLIAALPQQHLFGKAFGKGDVPITNLQLRVTGIVKVNADEGIHASKAYISVSGQPGKVFQTGDSLPYGVKVYDITPDAVILDNDGHLEKLPLPRQKLQFKTPTPQEHF